MSAKLLSPDQAAAQIARWRRDGKKTVAVSGSFDILHQGHMNLLSEARAGGDALLVLLNSDASVRAYKGPGRPLAAQETRAAQLAALPMVDAVVLFDEVVPLGLLEKLKPDILANGPDYGPDCIERPVVESWGGRILMTSPRTGANSTSAIAQRLGVAPNPRAVLLDRDGTLVEDPGYLSRPEQLVWKEGAADALKRLSEAGFLLIVITNQSGIGRGLFSKTDMEQVHQRLQGDLAKAGVTLKAIYHCPHRPEEACACRKPGTGLLLQAGSEHGLDLSKSWMVGDKCSDIEAGRMANMRTALVYSKASCRPAPHVIAPTLTAAAEAILSESNV